MRFWLRLIFPVLLLVLCWSGGVAECGKKSVPRPNSVNTSHTECQYSLHTSSQSESMQLPSQVRIITHEVSLSTHKTPSRVNSSGQSHLFGTNLRGSWLKPIKSSYILSTMPTQHPLTSERCSVGLLFSGLIRSCKRKVTSPCARPQDAYLPCLW